MLTGKKIPFINENSNMKNALKFISQKNLVFLLLEIVRKEQLELLLMDKLDVKVKKKEIFKN